MTSSASDNLGQLHIVTGRVTYASGVPSLSCNDGSATVADTGSANATVTFGDAFLAAPQVVATYLKATNAAGIVRHVTVEQATATTAEFIVHSIDDTGAGTTDVTNADPADGDGFMFIAIGMRNN